MSATKHEHQRAGIAGEWFGLAVVRQSIDPAWQRWACIYPRNQKTRWFKSRDAAQRAADKYNQQLH